MPRPTRSNANLNQLINNDSNNQIMADTVENEVNQLQDGIQTTTVTNQTSINLANTTTSANLQDLPPNNQINSNQQLNEMIQLLSSNMNNLPSETSNNQLLLLMTKLIESQIKQNDNQNISKKTEIKIKNFDGKEFNLFKNDVGRYLLSTNQKRFIEHDIYKQDKPPSNKEISENMHVQLFISTHCIPAIKSNVELNSKSAFEMLLFLENEYGQSGHRQINEAVNYICSGQLIAAKDLEGYINKFSLAFNTLEYNKMNVADQLKSKDQVPKIIENFVNFIEKQCFPGFVIKIFRSDRGTEFKNESVNEILTKRGIKTESSAPETHHQNGAAEQSMRMLKTKARILTDEYGHTPKNLFKNEAIKMACFLYNRIPNEQLGGKTPAEMFGVPNWSLPLYPFFTRVYALNKSKAFKKDVNSKFKYLIGYDEESKAYRLVNPKNWQLIINNDIAPIDNICIKVKPYNQQSDISDSDLQKHQNKRVCTTDIRLESTVTSDLFKNNKNIFNNALICSTIFESKIPKKFNEIDTDDIIIPMSHKESIESRYAPHWIQEMQNEMNSQLENNVWEIILQPEDIHLINCRWVYTLKYDGDNNVIFKARLVAIGFSQLEGLKYDEIFAPALSLQNLIILVV